ncbi:MAG: hypothetical protein E3J42_04905 [Dehalococcoidia bacterium]|nr:MAG: hypothetical protein E3J42_04905 [Dehalococcoidia bacterium]
MEIQELPKMQRGYVPRENMLPGDVVSFSFDVKAMYPVKTKGVSSQAYSYYKPEIRGETLGQAMVVWEG